MGKRGRPGTEEVEDAERGGREEGDMELGGRGPEERGREPGERGRELEGNCGEMWLGGGSIPVAPGVHGPEGNPEKPLIKC